MNTWTVSHRAINHYQYICLHRSNRMLVSKLIISQISFDQLKLRCYFLPIYITVSVSLLIEGFDFNIKKQ